LCRVANRNLSLTEWEQYLPGQPYRKICPTLPADPALLAEARALARNGDKAGAEASFRQLGELDPECCQTRKAKPITTWLPVRWTGPRNWPARAMTQPP
jgi:hypothetical protein